MRLSTPRLARVAADALAGDDQHHLRAPRLARAEKMQQRVMRFSLGDTVQIEPAVDGVRAPRDALLQLAAERRQRRRACELRWWCDWCGLGSRRRPYLGRRLGWRLGRSLRCFRRFGNGRPLEALSQRRHRTRHALPQCVLVVGQTPPAHPLFLDLRFFAGLSSSAPPAASLFALSAAPGRGGGAFRGLAFLRGLFILGRIFLVIADLLLGRPRQRQRDRRPSAPWDRARAAAASRSGRCA